MTPARLLIVEDEAILAKDLEARLTAVGYKVVGTAATGAEAVEVAGRLTPDLVLMDVHLRGDVDGVEAADRIRRTLHRPVVFLTAHAEEATLDRAGRAQPLGYVLKPFDERELRTGIEMALYKHRAEERLRESEERYATTLQSLGDGVVATDAAGRVTLLNPVAEALTGGAQAEAAGRPLADVFRVVHEQTRRPADGPVARVIATGQPADLDERTVLVRRDGGEVPIADRAAPIRDRAGRVTGVVLVFRDETEARRLQDELRQAHKMEAVGRLAGGIAHDFNNLLTIIQGYAALAAQCVPDDHPSREYATQVVQAADRAAAVTNQLLAFSRRQKLRPRPFDLNRRVTDLERMFARSFGPRIQVVLDLAPDLGPARADPGQVDQVIMNLVLNARDAMPDGGTLTVRTDDVEVGPDPPAGLPLAPGRYRRLAVTDTGVGMDAETQAHVFEPFFTTKEPGKGTGLGLSTVYGIVTQSGGHVAVRSAPGLGTTFTVYLPAADEPAAVAAPAIAPPARGSETVLLVEDQGELRDLARRLLEGAGYTVVTARDAEEARALLKDRGGDVHLLLTDVLMPGADGVELWRGLSAERPGLKVLFTSGSDELAPGAESDVAGRVLLKPFTPDEFTRKVREALDRA